MTDEVVVGRMAPTPSGQLHLGNVCSFAAAWLSARSQRGQLLLRMEDIDTTRARDGVEADQRRELEWLGLTWDRETQRQSERDYQEALQALEPVTYHCECTRAQIKASGGVYLGTCRHKKLDRGALRFRLPDGTVPFVDRRWGPRMEEPARFGDPVLQRRDGVVSYNLAVVVDDIRDQVTEVVRGADLLDYSAVQIHLWRALGSKPPTWMHGPLILGVDGRKLSKSHDAFHVGALREAGWQPAHIWRLVFPWLGIPSEVDNLEDAIEHFDPLGGVRGPVLLRLGGEDVPPPGAKVTWNTFGR
jgi:glutamyl/glutaminyl-tRNA synthetase